MIGNTIPGRVRLWRGMMELSAKPENPCRAISSGFMKKWNYNEDLTEECRHLVRILEKKIDVLCDDGNGDKEKVTRIKSLIPMLSAMSDLLSEIKSRKTVRIALDDFMQDDRGFTYISVRNSELERFSAK